MCSAPPSSSPGTRTPKPAMAPTAGLCGRIGGMEDREEPRCDASRIRVIEDHHEAVRMRPRMYFGAERYRSHAARIARSRRVKAARSHSRSPRSPRRKLPSSARNSCLRTSTNSCTGRSSQPRDESAAVTRSRAHQPYFIGHSRTRSTGPGRRSSPAAAMPATAAPPLPAPPRRPVRQQRLDPSPLHITRPHTPSDDQVIRKARLGPIPRRGGSSRCRPLPCPGPPAPRRSR